VKGIAHDRFGGSAGLGGVVADDEDPGVWVSSGSRGGSVKSAAA
jgi:hypothetical protein